MKDFLTIEGTNVPRDMKRGTRGSRLICLPAWSHPDILEIGMRKSIEIEDSPQGIEISDVLTIVKGKELGIIESVCVCTMNQQSNLKVVNRVPPIWSSNLQPQ